MKYTSKVMGNRIIELLNKLPYAIEHNILELQYDEFSNKLRRCWGDDKKTLTLIITKTENNLFMAYYRHGSTMRLPVSEEDIKDFNNFGCLLSPPEDNPLEIALEKLYNWLLKENLINEKNIEE